MANARVSRTCFGKCLAPAMGAALASALLLILTAATAAEAQTYTVLHNFTGGTDGATPASTLTLDRAGNLYGTTYAGGTGYGGVFKLKKAGSGWTFGSLYNFAGGSDASYPVLSPLVFGPNGTLYGVTYYGGGSGCEAEGGYGCGTVFNLHPRPNICPSISCPWEETVLYRFTGGADGANAMGPLVFDSAGNIYGTARQGGVSGCAGDGCGTVYELTQSGNNWTQSVLLSFPGQYEEGIPDSGVIFDASGNLYGTTQSCYTYLGGNVNGEAFELTPSGSGWTYSGIFTFGYPSGSSGYCPEAGLIFDPSGNLYTAAVRLGGVVDELSLSGGNWTLSNYYPLDPSNSGTCGPWSSLAMDTAGNLYGTTYCDGANGLGSVFKVNLTDGSYTDLHDFGGSDGEYPYGGVALDSEGNLYGTANEGGAGSSCTGGCGVVWEITP